MRLCLVRLGERVFCVKIVRPRAAAKMRLDGYNASTQSASCQAYKPYKQLARHRLTLQVYHLLLFTLFFTLVKSTYVTPK